MTETEIFIEKLKRNIRNSVVGAILYYNSSKRKWKIIKLKLKHQTLPVETIGNAGLFKHFIIDVFAPSFTLSK